MKLSINFTKNYLFYENFICTNELCVNLLISKLIMITKKYFFRTHFFPEKLTEISTLYQSSFILEFICFVG